MLYVNTLNIKTVHHSFFQNFQPNITKLIWCDCPALVSQSENLNKTKKNEYKNSQINTDKYYRCLFVIVLFSKSKHNVLSQF